LPEDEQQDISAIVDALTKKNTIAGKSARLSDSIGRIIDAPPEATLVNICDRIYNFLDTVCRNGQLRKCFLVSTDEIIDRFSIRADQCGYENAMNTLKETRYASPQNK
jgi:hypothetical protein